MAQETKLVVLLAVLGLTGCSISGGESPIETPSLPPASSTGPSEPQQSASGTSSGPVGQAEPTRPGSGGQPHTGARPTDPPGTGPTTQVDWENSAPSLKERIDFAAKEKDCASLQREFDNAEADNVAQRNRVGSGNGDLMDYIAEQMAAADCRADGPVAGSE